MNAKTAVAERPAAQEAAALPVSTGTALAAQPPAPANLAPPTAMERMLAIIERAAFDPNVDATKVGQLLEMARGVRADDAKAAYTREMLLVKMELPIIDRKGRIVIHEKGREKVDANIIQSTPYARWEDIDAQITPILNRHGFTLTHRTGYLDDGKLTVTAVVTHKDGHSEESSMALPLDTSGSKNNVQATGSSISYGKRYTAGALLNLRFKDEDDDGNYAGEPGKVTADQLEHITELANRVGADLEAFCEFMGVPALADILHKDYDKAIVALNLKATATAKKAAAKAAT